LEPVRRTSSFWKKKPFSASKGLLKGAEFRRRAPPRGRGRGIAHFRRLKATSQRVGVHTIASGRMNGYGGGIFTYRSEKKKANRACFDAELQRSRIEKETRLDPYGEDGRYTTLDYVFSKRGSSGVIRYGGGCLETPFPNTHPASADRG